MKKSRFSETQIVKIVNEAAAGMPVPDVCRKHNISTSTFYKWRAKYDGLLTPEQTQELIDGLEPYLAKLLENPDYLDSEIPDAETPGGSEEVTRALRAALLRGDAGS